MACSFSEHVVCVVICSRLSSSLVGSQRIHLRQVLRGIFLSNPACSILEGKFSERWGWKCHLTQGGLRDQQSAQGTQCQVDGFMSSLVEHVLFCDALIEQGCPPALYSWPQQLSLQREHFELAEGEIKHRSCFGLQLLTLLWSWILLAHLVLACFYTGCPDSPSHLLQTWD